MSRFTINPDFIREFRLHSGQLLFDFIQIIAQLFSKFLHIFPEDADLRMRLCFALLHPLLQILEPLFPFQNLVLGQLGIVPRLGDGVRQGVDLHITAAVARLIVVAAEAHGSFCVFVWRHHDQARDAGHIVLVVLRDDGPALPQRVDEECGGLLLVFVLQVALVSTGAGTQRKRSRRAHKSAHCQGERLVQPVVPAVLVRAGAVVVRGADDLGLT